MRTQFFPACPNFILTEPLSIVIVPLSPVFIEKFIYRKNKKGGYENNIFFLYRKRLAEKLGKVGHRTISITCRKKVGTKTGTKSGSTDSAVKNTKCEVETPGKEVINADDELKHSHEGI